MIRFRNNEYAEYFIDEKTGIITDANGNVKHTWVSKGREVTSINSVKMHVHCIQAHTKWGYKKGMIVHHKDENPLNNALSNLEYMTIGDHGKLHGNKRFEDEALREHYRIINTGENNPMYGKRVYLSEEGRKKKRESFKRFYSNPDNRIKAGNHVRGTHWCNNR